MQSTEKLRKLIEQFIFKNKGAISSEIVEYFKKKDFTEANIKSTLSRLVNDKKNQIKTIPINFSHNRKFYIKAEHEKDKKVHWNKVLGILRKENSIYSSTIDGIIARGGKIPKKLFTIIAGGYQKKHPTPNTILEKLLEAEVLKVYPTCVNEEYGEYLEISSNIYDSSKVSLAELQVVNRLKIELIKEYFRKNGFVSYNKVETSDPKKKDIDQPKVSTMFFDITGPSYLLALRDRNKERNDNLGFLVCDVLPHNVENRYEIQYFIKKIELLGFLKGIKKIFPVIVADSFHKEALKELQSKGILALTIKNIFGSNIIKTFNEISKISENRAAIITNKNSEQIYGALENFNSNEIFSNYSKDQEEQGFFNSIKGMIFELLVGCVINNLENPHIKFGEKVYNQETNDLITDIDVFATHGNRKIVCYECKAYKKDFIDLEDVDKWLKNISLIYEQNKKNDYLKKFNYEFEYWTTSGFKEDAKKKLDKIKETIKKYKIDYKDKDKVLKEFELAKDCYLVNALKILTEWKLT